MNEQSSNLEFVHDDNYFTIQGWMRSRLGLKGTQRDVYAIIYGFSQNNGESWFHGTIRYLSEWVGVNRQSIMTALAALVEKGLIEKRKKLVNGIWVCDYRVVQKLDGVYKIKPQAPLKIRQVVQKLDGVVQKLDSNNINDNIDNLTNTNVLVKGDNVASETVNESNPQKDSKPSYGNSTINSMFDYWQTQVGTPIISREKGNRRACYNLLRNKHIGEEKLRHAIEFVGEIKEDRFAPRISDFVDLQSKFNALCDYKNRRDQQTPTADANDAYKRNGAVSWAYKANGGAVPFVPSTHDARQDDYEAEQRRWVEAEKNRADDEFVQKMYAETMNKLNGVKR